jgi:hypothetical protein
MIAVIAALAIAVACADLGPVLPARTSPHVLLANLAAQAKIAKGDFAGAGAALAAWPVGPISFSDAGVPSEFAGAAEEAAKIWSEASDGKVKFAKGSEPFVKFEFVPMPADPTQNLSFENGAVIASIPIRFTDGRPVPRRSVVWNMARAFGYAVGIAPTTKRRHITGIVMYTNGESGPLFPDIAERSQLASILETRAKLLDDIEKKQTLTPAIPEVVVDKSSFDGGSVTQGDQVDFTLRISNKGNAPAHIDLESTCACMIAQPPPELDPGASVDVKVTIDSSDYLGALDKHLYVYTNDPENPARTVEMHLKSLPEYRLLPEGMPVVSLPDGKVSEYALTFYATPGHIVRLVNVNSGTPGVTASLSPFNDSLIDPLFGDRPIKRLGTRISVSFPENYRAGISWVRLVVVTDSKRKPGSDVTLEIHKGIFAQPKTAYFGNVSVGEISERIVTIEGASGPFKITALHVDGPDFSAKWEAVADANNKFAIHISGKPSKPGPISGQVVVETDSARYPKITIPITGSAK